MPTVVIVGGGVSGLSLAYRLQQAAPGAEITLLEQRDRPGGTVWTERRDGYLVETGPNGFLDTKPATLDLCRDLGLGERLVTGSESAARNRYLFLGGKLKALPSGLTSFLGSDLLSWRGKLALLAERLKPRRRGGPEESIDDFARRRVGAEVADVLVDAVVTGIYAGDPKLLSLKAAFPRMAELEERHGSVLKGMAAAAQERRRAAEVEGRPYRRPGSFWSLRDGLRELVEALRDRLRTPPVCGVTVTRIDRPENVGTGWLVRGEGNDRWAADAVVLACPTYQQAVALADLDRGLADEIDAIVYNRVAVVALGYRRNDVPMSLDGFGYLSPQRERRDVLGVQWCSSVYPGRAPDGHVLLRAMCGGWHRPEMADRDDDCLLAAVRGELRLALGVAAAPAFHHIVRWPRAIPQYHLGHLDRVARIDARAARHPGLFLAGNAYRGVALNDCTEQAAAVAGRVAKFLTSLPA